jgi:uncharacterized protein YaiI (UPF0178 family)
MRIWVDADACPRAIKDILYRAAERVRVETTFVANRSLRTPPSKYVRALQVPRGFDVADGRILDLLEPGDLVVTADVPFAAEVVAKQCHAIDPRGGQYSDDNIHERLATRDLMDHLRSVGVETSGPPPFRDVDRQAFANRLDAILTKHARSQDE